MDNDIHIKRSLLKNTGELEVDPAGEIVIEALPLANSTADIKDLSMTGNESELYIAYRAASTASPGAYFPQVRRIDIADGKIAPNTSAGKYGFDYDGIDITTTPTTGCLATTECTVVNLRDGTNVTIQFSPTVNFTGTMTINGEPFDFAPGASRTADQICADCDGTGMASSLEVAINRRSTLLTRGITATSATSTVTLHGMNALDFVEGEAAFNQVAGDMGDIYLFNNKWHVPFINRSLNGAAQDKVSVIYGNTGGNMTTQDGIDIAPVSASPMVALSFLSSSFSGTRLYLAGIAKVGSTAKLYELDPDSYAILNSNVTAMPGFTHTAIKVAASASNVFVMTQTNTTPIDHMVGVYSNIVAYNQEFLITNSDNVDATTDNALTAVTGSKIKQFKLVAYGSEARLATIVDTASAAGDQLLLARLSSNSMNWLLSCKDCVVASDTLNKEASRFVSLNVSPIRVKNLLGTDYTLGSTGATANQSKRDIFFVSYGGGADTTVKVEPQMGVINAQVEQINSTALPADEDSGLFRAPFFKN